MSSDWELNGQAMSTVDVVVTVRPSVTVQVRRRKQERGILHGRMVRHNLGYDYDRIGLTFAFHGPHAARYERMAWARSQMEDVDRFTLQAPDAPNEVYVSRASKEATMELDGADVDHGVGLGVVLLKVQASIVLDYILDLEDPDLLGGVAGPAVAEGALAE